MAYTPPSHVLEVLKQIGYEEWMPAGDPRYVDTQAARGSEKTFARLARKFGWDPATNAYFAPNEKHVLFFGHIAPRAPGRSAREGGDNGKDRRHPVSARPARRGAAHPPGGRTAGV